MDHQEAEPRGLAMTWSSGRFQSQMLAAHSWLMYAFLYIPILVLVVFSFNESRQTAVWNGFTLNWYAKALQNEWILKSLKNSLGIATLTALISTATGTLCALALDRLEFRGKTATRILLFLPMISPEIVVGAALLAFFGLVQYTLDFQTVLFAHLGFGVSYATLLIKARMKTLDRSLEEAAMDLGAGPLQTFIRITLPLLTPGIMASLLLVFTVSMDDYVITSFVAGSGSTTLPLQIYSMIKVGVTPEVNAISTLLLAFTILLIMISQYFIQKSDRT